MGVCKAIFDFLIRATERFYMLSPRCLPLLASSDCYTCGRLSIDGRPRERS